MAKFFVFLAVVAVIIWLARAPSRRRERTSGQPGGQPMVRCAHCGVHFPRAEALAEGERAYCSEEHRRLGARS